MRVLRISLTYPTQKKNGIGLHAFHLSQDPNIETLIITKKQYGKPLKSIRQVRVHRIKLNSVGFKQSKSLLLNLFPVLNFIISQLKFFLFGLKSAIKFNPQIVQCHSPHGFLYALFFKIILNKKTVLSFHGSDLQRLKNHPLILKIILKPFDLILVVDTNMLTILNSISKNLNTFHAPGGVEYDFFNYDSDNFTGNQFLAVGNVRWQKDYQTMVDGFKIFNKKNENKFVLKIIGDYAQNEVFVRNNQTEKIIFSGNRKKTEIRDEMNNSIALILTSISEGLPKVILEGMSCGLPIITTDVGSCGILVDNSKKGIIISKIKSPNVLSNSLQEFLKTRNSYNKNYIKESVKQYSWITLRKNLYKRYDELLKE